VSGLDLALFRWINGTAVSPLLDRVMPVVTDARVWAVVLLVLAVSLVVRGGRRGRATALVLAAALALSDASSSQVWKPFFGRPRPCRTLENVRLLVRCGGRNGFPSNHSANAGAVTAVLGTFYPATLWFVPAAAVIVAWSRVYVGVHYPGDAVAGLAYGILLGLAMARPVRRRWLSSPGGRKDVSDGPSTLQKRGS